MRGATRKRWDTVLRALIRFRGCSLPAGDADAGADAGVDGARGCDAGRRGRRSLQRLYHPVLTSGLLAGALPPRTRVAAIGSDRRWFIDWMVNEGPTALRCTTA